MTRNEFVKRLALVADRQGLTTSDLALWFERPRPTVATWRLGQNTPVLGPVFDECVRRLVLLAESKAFPVPYMVLKFERPDYIRKALADALAAGVSARRSPNSRNVLRRRPGKRAAA